MSDLLLIVSLVPYAMLAVYYVLVAMSCILSVVPFLAYDGRYDREGTGSEEWA